MMKIDWSGRSHKYTEKEIRVLSNVIRNADPLTGGKYLKLFENSLKNFLGKKNIFATSSAASAIELISMLCQIKQGDEVIIPGHTYCATAIPFARNGAKIIWSDIELKTRVVSLEDILKKITKKTKVIVVVHLYGYAFDVLELKKRVKKINKKIIIVEDCAQAFGAKIKKFNVGTIGDFSCYSFHAQKNLTTLGEGGAIYVKNANLAKKVSGLRHNGHCDYKKRKYYWKPAMGNLDIDLKDKWPYKFTLSEIQCAAGYLLIRRIKKLNNDRVKRAKKVINNLKKFKEIEFLNSFKDNRHVYHLLSARVISKKFNRDDLINLLYNKYKIKCAVQYYPLYKYPLFQKKGFGKANCPNTDIFFKNMISFPFHHWMTEKNLNYMILSIKKSLEILNKS